MDFNYDFQGAIMKKIVIYFTFIGGLFSMDSRQLSQVSLSFDGKDDYVSFANPINWSEKDKISFSVWIKLNNDMPTSHQDILRQDKNGNPDFYIGFDGKGIFEFALRAGGYNELELQAGEFSEWSNWVHIVGTYDGTSQKLYKNGIEIGSATKISGNLNFSSDNPFTLGCSPHGGAPNSFFDGSIDDFAIWDAALTSSEIEALYNSGMGLSASKSSANYKSAGNLKAYWHINEGSGNTISDNVDNNNGTIIGASWQNTGMNIQKNKPPSSFEWVDTSRDTVDITKENLAKEYKFEWTASTDADGDALSYQLYAKVGSSPRQMINESIDGTSFVTTYQDFLGAAFESFPIVNAVTAVFDMTVTDGLDTVKLVNRERSLKFVDNNSDVSSVKGISNTSTTQTLSLWAYPTKIDRGYMFWINKKLLILLHDSPDKGVCFELETDTKGWHGLCEYVDKATYESYKNKWNHFVGVYNGSSLNIYVNGSLIGTKESGGNLTLNSGDLIELNAEGWNYNGFIDEIAYWDDALSAAEVSAIYNSGSGLNALSNSGDYTSSENLYTYWRMNEGTGSIVKDATSNGIDGNISGTTKWSNSSTIKEDSHKVIYIRRYEYLSTIDEQIPTDFALHENYPNPFNPTTTLRFDLPEVSDVNVVIYNMLGQKVRTFNMNSISAGSHSIKWNATNDLGDPVGAGVYLYQLQAKDFVKTRKMVLLK